MQTTELPATAPFRPMYLVSEVKSGVSTLALARELGVSYPGARLLHHKLMTAMQRREEGYTLSGSGQADDADLGGELPGGKTRRDRQDMVAFVAAVSLCHGRPRYAKFAPMGSLKAPEIVQWARRCVAPGTQVARDGLACFAFVTQTGCAHPTIVMAGRRPRQVLQFK